METASPLDLGPPVAWNPWTVGGHAAVSYYRGERRSVERVARRLFGRVLSPPELAGLAGAPDGTPVEAGTLDGGLYLDVGGTPTSALRAFVLIGRGATGPVVVNHAVLVRPWACRRRRVGLWSFCRQLAVAESLQVASIRITAGRGAGENGYYTWPRFGFDGPLPPSIRGTLPPSLRGATRVLDLMVSDAGRGWWRRHGRSIAVAFVVAADSRSRRVLEAYCHLRIAAAGGPGWPAAELPPTALISRAGGATPSRG
jgi:hypothetical protein